MHGLTPYLTRRLDDDGRAPAVVGDVTVTYADLADRVDAVLSAVGADVPRGGIIALDVTSPALGLVGVLAADRLGAAFLPLDTAAPMTRRQRVIESSGARVVLRETGPWQLEVDRVGLHRPPWPLGDPGYVIYTSGTSGPPKGVHVPKRALVERLEGLRQVPGLRPGGSFVALSALSFDIALAEILLPLVVGGRVVAADLAARTDPAALDRVLAEHRPDVAQATPSFWRLMLAGGWQGDADLTVWCGGEAMSPDLAAALCKRSAAVWNLYGPTEATIWATAWRVDPDRAISLGTALPGTTIDLVDTDGEIVSGAGTQGEVRISGAGVADGYLGASPTEDARFTGTGTGTGTGNGTNGTTGRSYLTGDRAVRGEDGSLCFLGREDHQVKLRGHRIELGEIEWMLESHPAVVEAAVVVLDRDDPEAAHLSAAVVTHQRITDVQLRRWLADRLPAVMVPRRLRVATALPRTSAGKLDRVEISAWLAGTRRP